MEIIELNKKLQDCVRCGSCRSVCPVFEELKHESGVARGKISLIEAALHKELGYSDKMADAISQCLLCKQCVENCTNSVPVDKIVLEARARHSEDRGLGALKKVLSRSLLTKNGGDPWFLKVLPYLEKIAFRPLPAGEGLCPRFPLPLLRNRGYMPPLASPPFMKGKEDHFPAEQEQGKVTFFPGCFVNYFYKEIAEKTLRLLNRLNISVFLQGQLCCGLPPLSIGDRETAAVLAKRNVELLADYDCDAIVVVCPSCGTMLKEYYRDLLESEGPELRAKAEDIGHKVMDITQYIHRISPSLEGKTLPLSASPGNAKKKRITYHDPCHLRRGLGATEEPIALLKSLPGFSLVEMSHQGTCCGFGGSFNLSFYDLSTRILQKKMESIRETDAEMVLTGCPGCVMQLKDGAEHFKQDIEVLHTIELLEEYY